MRHKYSNETGSRGLVVTAFDSHACHEKRKALSSNGLTGMREIGDGIVITIS